MKGRCGISDRLAGELARLFTVTVHDRKGEIRGIWVGERRFGIRFFWILWNQKPRWIAS